MSGISQGLCDNSIKAWTNLVRAESAVLAAVESELKEAGYPPLACYDVLLELKRAEGDRLRPLQLQQRILLRQYNLSRLIDRMESDGLVARQRCPTDARGLHIVLQAAGREMLKKMWPVYACAIRRHFAAKLALGEHEVLAALLEKLLDTHQEPRR